MVMIKKLNVLTFETFILILSDIGLVINVKFAINQLFKYQKICLNVCIITDKINLPKCVSFS